MSNELVQAAHYKTELDYAREVGKMIVKTGKWSKDWNEDTVAVLVLYARDLGIHPVKALMNGFDIIQGKISMKPILMSDMIRKAGHSIKIIQNDDVACILKGRRKDNDDECTISFSYEDAKRAGIHNKENWNKWRSDMLYSRAMGRLGRMLFSDVIGGAYTDGEMEDIKATSREDKEPEISQTDIEVTAVVQEAARPALEASRFGDLLTEVLLRQPVEEAEFKEFLKDFCAKRNLTEDVVIRSSLNSDSQMTKLVKELEAYQQALKPSEEVIPQV